MKKLYTIFLCTLCFVLTVFTSTAQDIKGTDFWYTIPKSNPIVSGGALTPAKIAVIGYYDCTLTIEYPARVGQPGATQNVAITGGQRTVVTLDNDFQDLPTQYESPQNNGIHITSTQPVAIYAINYEASSSEISPVLPTPQLGINYLTVAYRENTDDGFNARVSVVATENNTQITIKLPQNTWCSRYDDVNFAEGALTRLPGATWTVTLNKGQTYSFQSNQFGQASGGAAPAGYSPYVPAKLAPYYPAASNTVGNNLGLNGVQITSNDASKPIVVIGGADCTWLGNVPYPGCGACDITFTQVPPTEKWGTKFATVQTLIRTANIAPIPTGYADGSIADYLWFTTRDPNTTIRISGINGRPDVVRTIAAAGDYWLYESPSAGTLVGNLTVPGATFHTITSDKPIQIVQMQKGWQCDNTGNNKDPSQMLVIDTTHWKDSYIITNPTDLAGGVLFTDNFLTIITNDVVTPRASIQLVLNGAVTPIPAANWQQMGTTTFYTNRILGIAPGAAIKLRSLNQTPFAFNVSGAGGAGSYGYMGGATCGLIARGRATIANVCLADSTRFSLLSAINGQVNVTNPLTQSNPIYLWRIDLNGDGIYDNGTLDPANLNGPNPAYLFTNPGTYNVILELTDVAGCFDRDTFQVEVISSLAKPKVFGPKDACPGSPVKVYVESPIPVSGYTWTDPTGTGVISGPLGDTIVYNPGNPPQTIRVKSFTALCSSLDTTFTPNIVIGKLPAPVYTGDSIICPGQSVVLRALGGIGSYIFHTDTNQAQVANNTSGILNRNNIQKDTTVYVKYVENAPSTCESYFGPMKVRVVPFPANPILAGPSSICFDSVANLTVSNPNVIHHYDWYNTASGGTLLASDTIKYRTSNLSKDSTFFVQTYIIDSKNPNDPQTCYTPLRTSFPVKVDSKPVRPTITGNQYICEGTSGELFANVPSGTPFENNYTYEWFNDLAFTSAYPDNNKTDNKLEVYPFNFNSDTIITFYLKTSVRGCAADPTSYQVNFSKLPIVSNPRPIQVCQGQSTTIRVDPATTQTVTYQYFYYDQAGNQLNTNPNNSGLGIPAGRLQRDTTYVVKVINTTTGCISNEFFYNLKVLNSPGITSVAGSKVICAGTSTNLVLEPRDSASVWTINWYGTATGGSPSQGGSNTGTFTTPTINSDTTFYVQATNSIGCTTNPRVPVSIQTKSTPQVANVSGNSACDGQRATLVATPTGDSEVKYSWYDSPQSLVPLNGGNKTTGTFVTPILNYSPNPVNFYVEPMNIAASPNCIGQRIAVPVTVNTSKQLPAPTVNCGLAQKDSIQVYWTTIAGATGYEGSIDNFVSDIRPIPGDGSTDNYTFGELNEDQNYTLYIRAIKTPCQSVQNSAGSTSCRTVNCLDSIIMRGDTTIYMATYDGSGHIVSVDSLLGIEPLTKQQLQFDYIWTPDITTNAGNSTSDPGPFVLPIPEDSTTATYYVEVQHVDQGYLTCPSVYGKVVLIVVPIDAQVKFSIPNAFSPDGNNPFLIPKMDGAFEYSLQIYDRWGGMVFETTDPNINWNGLIGNDKEKAPDGVYVYIAKLSDGRNKTNTFTGTVTLTRGTF
jgi:hypothetical protein